MATYTWQTQPTITSSLTAHLATQTNIAINNANTLIELMKDNASTASSKGGKDKSVYDNTSYLSLVTTQGDILSSVTPLLNLQKTLDLIDDIKYCATANAPYYTTNRSAPHYSSENSYLSTNNDTNNGTVRSSGHCGVNNSYQGGN